MTSFTNGLSGKEENTNGATSAWTTIDGSDDSSPSPTRNHANATYVEPQTESLKSNIAASELSSTRSHRFVEMPATPATYDNDELASLLIEGWQRGWLKVARPKCRHHPYSGGS